MLLIRNRLNIDSKEPWVKAISEHFETGATSKLPRPVSSFFVCPKEKLLYAPIAKCGCTSLKRLMVELSELDHTELILKHDVHRVTDVFVTGAQLKDHTNETIQTIINSDDYYKFAVVRDPVRRIISAYTEKFLVNRLTNANLLHTIDVLRQIRCESRPDLNAGVSFRSFVNFLTASPPQRLDPHWAPQHLFLHGVNRFNAIFTMEQMDELAKQLSAITGKDIQLGKHNASVAHGSLERSQPGRYADTLPSDLDNIEGISSEDFMAPDLVEALEHYYQEDVKLYLAAQKGLQNYVPAPLPNTTAESESLAIPLQSAHEVARFISLHSKGFFALRSDGRGKLPIIITNAGSYTLDFNALPNCLIMSEFRDIDGKSLAPPTAQAVAPGIIEANGIVRILLDLNLDPALVTRSKTVAVSMRFGQEFLVEDIAPLHITLAARVAMPEPS